MAKQQNTASAHGAATTRSNILPFVRRAPVAPPKAPSKGQRAAVDDVVQIRGRLVRPEMVEAVSNLLEKMKRGEPTGVMFITSTPSGDVSGVYGDFADRLEYAIYATTKHLDMLVTRSAEHPGIGYTSLGAQSE